MPYPHVIENAYPGPHRGVGEPHARAAVVRHINPDLANGFAELLASGEALYFQIRALGGAVADVPADATAYAHRDGELPPGGTGAQPGRREPRVGPPASELRRGVRQLRRPTTGRADWPRHSLRSTLARLRGLSAGTTPTTSSATTSTSTPRGRGKRSHNMNETTTADLSGQTTVILGGPGNIGEGILRAHIAARATSSSPAAAPIASRSSARP